MPTRISASLCDPRTFHTRCQFRQSYQLAPLGIILLSHWSGTGLRATLLSWRAKRIARKCASDCTKPREAKNKDSLPRSVKDFYNCFAQIDEAKYHWLRNDSRSIDSFLPSLSPPPPPLPPPIASSFTCGSRVISRNSPKRRAWSQTIQAPNCPL